MEVKPYNIEGKSKREEVEGMFNKIAPTYDRLNHLLSFNIDKSWRKKAIAYLLEGDCNAKQKHVLDVATGTGDLAILEHKSLGCKVTGADISAGMLEVAKQKIEQNGLNASISLVQAQSEQLPFEDDSFDACSVAFGVRNFGNLQAGLKEMSRVTKKGGRVVILEFSRPTAFPFKQIYTGYFKYILPTVGGWISKDKKAYEYLPDSALSFPAGRDFENIMSQCGLEVVKSERVTFGIATIYVGTAK